MQRRVRRSVLAAAVIVLAAGAVSAFSSSPPAYLHGDGVAVLPDGHHLVLPNGTASTALLPDSRVLAPSAGTDPAPAEALAAAQQAWLASGTVPGEGTPWESMTRDALLDLHTLTLANGGTAAGWPTSWRYVWPRDASFVAVAFARTGHLPDAERELAYLQRVQGADGLFEARYLLDGSGPPDERLPQSDGTGWSLWATRQVLASVPAPLADAQAEQLRTLIERSTSALLRLTDDGRHLPPASSDYREVSQPKVTLGTVGPFLAGLQAAGPLAGLLGDPKTQVRAERAAGQFELTLVAAFGPDYARTVDGHSMDAAVTFLLPPFTGAAPSGARQAATYTAKALARPGGGLAPGTGRHYRRISWTPETTLFALTSAAAGDHAAAAHWLDWLDAHRTAVGALPEKVNADGSPGGAAPLAWTDALVLLTMATLTPSS